VFLESRSFKFIARSRFRLVVDIWYARQVSIFTSTYLDGIHLLTSRRRWFCITSILIHHNTRITRPENLSGLRPDDSGERTTRRFRIWSADHDVKPFNLRPVAHLISPSPFCWNKQSRWWQPFDLGWVGGGRLRGKRIGSCVQILWLYTPRWMLLHNLEGRHVQGARSQIPTHFTLTSFFTAYEVRKKKKDWSSTAVSTVDDGMNLLQERWKDKILNPTLKYNKLFLAV